MPSVASELSEIASRVFGSLPTSLTALITLMRMETWGNSRAPVAIVANSKFNLQVYLGWPAAHPSIQASDCERIEGNSGAGSSRNDRLAAAAPGQLAL